jgi:hypothetical protein
MTKALITAAAFAAFLLAGPVNAAQTSGAGSDNSAVVYAPGQHKGQATNYAPGQRKKPGESARAYAPGHLKKKPTTHTSKYTKKHMRSYESSGATGAIKKKTQTSY